MHSVRSTLSMLTLGDLGACPPENFEDLHLLRLNLRAFKVYLTLVQTAKQQSTFIIVAIRTYAQL